MAKNTKSYKQPPLPMVEGTSAHKAALAKSSPATFVGKMGDAFFSQGKKSRGPHEHEEGTEGVTYLNKSLFTGMMAGAMANRRGTLGEDSGADEEAGYESSRGSNA